MPQQLCGGGEHPAPIHPLSGNPRKETAYILAPTPKSIKADDSKDTISSMQVETNVVSQPKSHSRKRCRDEAYDLLMDDEYVNKMTRNCRVPKSFHSAVPFEEESDNEAPYIVCFPKTISNLQMEAQPLPYLLRLPFELRWLIYKEAMEGEWVDHSIPIRGLTELWYPKPYSDSPLWPPWLPKLCKTNLEFRNDAGRCFIENSSFCLQSSWDLRYLECFLGSFPNGTGYQAVRSLAFKDRTPWPWAPEGLQWRFITRCHQLRSLQIFGMELAYIEDLVVKNGFEDSLPWPFPDHTIKLIVDRLGWDCLLKCSRLEKLTIFANNQPLRGFSQIEDWLKREFLTRFDIKLSIKLQTLPSDYFHPG